MLHTSFGQGSFRCSAPPCVISWLWVLALLEVKESESPWGLGGFNGTVVENIQN